MSKLRPDRATPAFSTVTEDPEELASAVRTIVDALNIRDRRTRDVENSFVTVKDLVDVGLITYDGQNAQAVTSTTSTGGVTFANPTATVGPTAVNGTALTAMRSDASPALNLSANYDVTGVWRFDSDHLNIRENLGAGSYRNLQIGWVAGPEVAFQTFTATGANYGFYLAGTKYLSIATTGVNVPTGTLSVASTSVRDGAILTSGTVAAARLPSFGSAAAGIVGASGGGATNYLRADGTWSAPPGTSGVTFANPTATVGPTAVNGTAATAMRSDAAPAINASANYTMTGVWTWSYVGTGAALNLNANSTNWQASIGYNGSAEFLINTISFSGAPSLGLAVSGNRYFQITPGNVDIQFGATLTVASTSVRDGAILTSGTVAAARLPSFGSAAAGIVGASGGGTSNYLRADGTWAAPTGTTYAVFTSTVAGLAPASGGGTANFLRADGTWAGAAASGANTDITALDQDVTVTATGTIAANTIGYRGLPQSAKTAAYTLAAGDQGKHISITTGGISIPVSVFAAGEAVTIFNNSGSTQTITPNASVTLRMAGTANTGTRNFAQYGLCTILCIVGGATPTFVISGAGVS